MAKGQFNIEEGGSYYAPSGANNDLQFVDGALGHGLDVNQTGKFRTQTSLNRIWGLNNAYSDNAIRFEPGSWYQFGARPSVPGSTGSDWSLGSYSGQWANIAKSIFDTGPDGEWCFGAANSSGSGADMFVATAAAGQALATAANEQTVTILSAIDRVIVGMVIDAATALSTDDIVATLRVGGADATSGMSVTLLHGTTTAVFDLAHAQFVAAGTRIGVKWRQSGTQVTAGINARVTLLYKDSN
jgi:hypothetical protein